MSALDAVMQTAPGTAKMQGTMHAARSAGCLQPSCNAMSGPFPTCDLMQHSQQ